MAFRRPHNPLDRFSDLYIELNRERGWFESATYLSHAAIAGLCCAGKPRDVADAIRDAARQLKEGVGWTDHLRSELRFVVAAMLSLKEDQPRALIAEVKRVRKLFREVGIRRDATYEMLAILVMRSGLNGRAISAALAQRVQDLYEEMKTHQWWLTGADDLPACAMLALRGEPAGLIGQRIEQLYQGLHKEGFSKCNELQSSANLLYLCEDRAELAARRAGKLLKTFKSSKQSIRRSDYNELAILSFLDNAPKKIVDCVLSHRDDIRTLTPRLDKRLALSLAANIAFLDFMQGADTALSINQIKLIVDVQACVAAQRATAAVMAAAAGA